MKRKTLTEKLGPALAGMETAVLEQLQAQAEAQAAELSAKLLEPMGSIDNKAGRLERESPLFFGTGENPSLFGG